MMISLISLMYSMALLKCLGLQLSKKPSENLNLGRLCFVFIGKKWPFKVIVKVPVKLRLSDDPAIEIDLEFCFAIVWFIGGMYFKEVWPKIMINESGILYFSTIMTMLWRYNNSAFFLASSWISTLPVVRVHFLKLILRNKLRAQCEDSRLIWLKLYWGFCAIKAFAADVATAEDTSPPVLWRESKNLCTLWSRLPKSNGLPRGSTLKFLLTSQLFFCAFDIFSLYSLENLRALLSLSGFSLVWNFVSAALDLCIAAYLPIS